MKVYAQNGVEWTFLHPRANESHLGFIPDFLNADDPNKAAVQFHKNYVSGWLPFEGFKYNILNHSIRYPGDPVLYPIAMGRLRDERIYFYQSSWINIVQPDDKYEVARMD